MNLGLFFDTETTDKDIIWDRPSTLPAQPHIVQLAAHLVDLDSRKIIETINLIVKPDGWIIPDKVIEVHGITNELANEVGIPEVEAVRMFMLLWSKCSIRIAHNTTFDNRIIWIALSRYLPDTVSKEVWKNKDLYYCTFQNFKKLIGGCSGHKLKDAYKYFTGEPLTGAHNAMNDVNACIAVYLGFWISRRVNMMLRKQLYNGNSSRQNSLHNSIEIYYADKEMPICEDDAQAQARHVTRCKDMLKRDIASADSERE